MHIKVIKSRDFEIIGKDEDGAYISKIVDWSIVMLIAPRFFQSFSILYY